MHDARVRAAVLFASILILAAVLLSQGRVDSPPVAPPDQWVPLGDHAGLVIRGRPRPTREAKGRLWVKVDGTWVSAVLEQPQQIVPAS